MLGLAGGGRTRQVVGRVGFDMPMLYSEAHDPADVLAQAAGKVQVAVLFCALQGHQQVAHLQIGDTPIT
ncbi:hypothetical protein D3C85_1569110 [compost metagenome]